MKFKTDKVVLTLCATCKGADDANLQSRLATEDFAAPVELRRQDCMNGCARPVSLALQGVGRATCFFAGVDPAGDAEDIVSTLHSYIAAPAGWIEDARPCGRLRFCLTGRVPAF